jgi:7,8-dihydro-6-hydroxymethylpterin-pyrophosphokinase (HPPK)
MNNLTWITSKRISRLYDCKELYFSHCRPGRSRHSTTKTEFDRRRAAKVPVLTTVNPMSRVLGRHVQHVKFTTSSLDNGPHPELIPSITENDDELLGRASSRRHATTHRAMIAFGSNLGDRVSMIEQACEKMLSRGIKVKAQSSLYESTPMYVTDQDVFYNGVCEVRLPYGRLCLR